MSDAAFAELRADIAANGLLAPITLYEDKILDGWHRYNACEDTGTESRFRTFDGDENAARHFVVSANLMRRHLDTGERAMVAARFATMPQGNPGKGPKTDLTVTAAADLFNLNRKTVLDARTVLASGDDEIIANVQSGKVSVSGAAKKLKASTPKPAPKPKQLPANVTTLPKNTGSVTLEQWAALALDMRTELLCRRNSTLPWKRTSAASSWRAIAKISARVTRRGNMHRIDSHDAQRGLTAAATLRA